jgi:hypothetical protein
MSHHLGTRPGVPVRNRIGAFRFAHLLGRRCDLRVGSVADYTGGLALKTWRWAATLDVCGEGGHARSRWPGPDPDQATRWYWWWSRRLEKPRRGSSEVSDSLDRGVAG